MGKRYVVIDLETTGNSPKNGNKIIQFAACVVEDGKITESYSSYVNPGREIPPFIEELTGISMKKVELAPRFSEIAPKIVSLLDGAYFVAHNASFDLSFLQEELKDAGFPGFYGPVLDTVELARILLPTADSYKLNELALCAGIDHAKPHRADSDAYVTAQLFIMFINRLLAMPRITILQLLKLSKSLKSDLSLFIGDQLHEKDKKVEELSPRLEIYRGIALKKQPDEDVFVSEKATGQTGQHYSFPDSTEDKERLMMPAFENYEIRSGQFQMMDVVFSSFSDKEHAMIEAGTGVGKSLAYLIPAAYFSKNNNKKVVVSTYTIQLQEQLLKNDLTLLEKILPFHINVVLLKGKNNYLSLAKFEQSLHEEDQNYDHVLTKMQILVWLLETDSGDYDELHLSSGGMSFWRKISHEYDDDSFWNMNQHWNHYDFYFRARNRANKADLIITNHSFLLADLTSKNSVLPSYHYCIIDEGHHFEKEASKFFGDTIDYLSVRTAVHSFRQFEQFLYQRDSVVQNSDMDHPFIISQIYEELNWEMEEFFKLLIGFAKTSTGNQSHYKIETRISEKINPSVWKGIAECGTRLSFLLKDLILYADKWAGYLKKQKSASGTSYTEKEETLIQDLGMFVSGLEDFYNKLKRLIIDRCESQAVWIETDERAHHNSTFIYSRPVTVSDRLQEIFFSKKDSVVVTSATLTVKNSFRYILNELGLETNQCRCIRIPSPFRYEKQVKLIIPNDLPEVNAVSLDEYVSAISEHIISVAEVTKGRLLILFTSHEMLKQTYELVKESGLLEEYVLIAQGITSGSRSRLTRNFRKFKKAILFGINSFWEGIDIPGEDLSCLIIVRLPFSPPTEPFTEAKCELIARNGGNSFLEYSLPEAVIRFKQGFGRLIRTKMDRGVVLVFDRRIVTTSYGRAFLQSIPNVPVKQADITEVVAFIQNWLS